MFAYKLNTSLPELEKMYMYDIVLMFKNLNEIIKKENGEGGDDNIYENKMNEYQKNINSQMNEYKSNFSSSIPKIPTNFNTNMGNITSGFKMPKY